MNAKLLRSKMVLFGDTNNSLAEALGLSAQRLSEKINERNGAQFTQGEIEIIKYRYDLSSQEVIDIFFTREVS
ncbi:MAG: XRE family transcriptional regulator [Clostridiales bacterium]|nr:XRE family transcriptional regulator [Clostridiales bacterium]